MLKLSSNIASMTEIYKKDFQKSPSSVSPFDKNSDKQLTLNLANET